MRTKALLGLAAIAVSALTATAQNNVYSLNVVGYYNVTVPAGKFQIVANQLVSSDYKVSTLLNVPDQTQVLKWTGSSFGANLFDATFGWDDANMTLGPGEAAFIKNNSANPFTITFVGEVNQDSNTLNLTAGYKMASLFTPQAGLIQTDFGYAPVDQEQVLQWKVASQSYGVSTFDSTFGWDSEPSIAVGEGVFFKSPSAHTWVRQFKVQ